MTVTDTHTDFVAPTGREEAWRFTPLKSLRGIYSEINSPVPPQLTIDAATGVVVTSVDTTALPAASGPVDWSSAIARAATTQSTVITLPRDFVDSTPTVVRIEGSGVDTPSVAHIVINAELFSRGVVVLEHSGSATYSANVEINVADGAHLTVVSIQSWSADTVHLGRQHAVVGRDATFRSFIATFGGKVVRLVPTVEYAGPGGNAELMGVFFADAGQHLEHRSLIDHAVPHCRSNVMYKGALKGDPALGPEGIARTVWVGDVIIRAAAIGTETYELNRNLVLTDAARADSVPNLEIETGEIVGAGHASATGRFDDEQLFYLQSRGIPADVATRLVVRGFFADVITKLGVPEWESHLQAAIDSELGLAAGSESEDDQSEDDQSEDDQAVDEATA